MVDFSLTDEQQRWQQIARKFSYESLAPVVPEYDNRPEPLDRMPWGLVKEASELGLRTLSFPKSLGGAGADWFTLCLVAEEIGTGDVGFATTIEICWMYTPVLVSLLSDAQKEKFLRPFVADPLALYAPGWTEPNAGSDTMMPYNDPDGGMQTRAERRGDQWAINGQKCFTSSGGCGSLYLVMTRTDFTKPANQGATLFIVPADTPGLTITRVHEKSAHRLNPQSEETFEESLVGDDHRVGPVNEGFRAARDLLGKATCVGAASLLGPGRAALEATADYVKNHVEGGKPLIQHQSTAMMIADMALRMDAARLVTWNAAWQADRGVFTDPTIASKAKVLASEASFDVARAAVELFAEKGCMTDYPIERYLREASGSLHHFGTNQILRLKIAGPYGHNFSEPER